MQQARTSAAPEGSKSLMPSQATDADADERPVKSGTGRKLKRLDQVERHSEEARDMFDEREDEKPRKLIRKTMMVGIEDPEDSTTAPMGNDHKMNKHDLTARPQKLAPTREPPKSAPPARK